MKRSRADSRHQLLQKLRKASNLKRFGAFFRYAARGADQSAGRGADCPVEINLFQHGQPIEQMARLNEQRHGKDLSGAKGLSSISTATNPSEPPKISILISIG